MYPHLVEYHYPKNGALPGNAIVDLHYFLGSHGKLSMPFVLKNQMKEEGLGIQSREGN